MSDHDHSNDLSRQAALDEALTKVLSDHADHASDRGLITGWVVVAEAIGDDGEPWLRIIHSKDQPAWRRVGLIEYAATVQRASIYERD